MQVGTRSWTGKAIGANRSFIEFTVDGEREFSRSFTIPF